MSLSLNCLILGDDPDQMFDVQISPTANVSSLKDLIKEKKAPRLNHVAASDLELWQVSFPTDAVDTEQGNIDLSGAKKLTPSNKKLATIFTDVADDHLHIVVKVRVNVVQTAVAPPLLSLNCFVLGEPSNQIFAVEIPPEKSVSILKDLIKEKQAPRLNHVAASELELWQVSFPIDALDTEQGNIDLSGAKKLKPSNKKLATIFTDVADDRLHIVVKVRMNVVQTAVAPPLLSLNCFVLGDTPNQIFDVKISPTEKVSFLKVLIKENMAPRLNHVAAPDLELWQVSLPIKDIPIKDPPTSGQHLRPENLLSNVYPSELGIDQIHVVVRVPALGVSRSGRRGPPPSAYNYNPPGLAEMRKKFCNKRARQAPSAGGQPKTFRISQEDPEMHIPCNRPADSPTTMPLSLLDPAFGQFLDDAENHVPTPEDVQFFLQFRQAMADIYDKEEERRVALEKIFTAHGLPIKATKIGDYTTDGDMSYKFWRYLIAELKNEIGSQAAEPYFQATLYYLEAMRNLAGKHVHSVLPCILVLIFGPYIAFAGAAWTDRPTVQMLSPAIPCHYQGTDVRMEGMLVRHLGALRCATLALKDYYEKLDLTPLAVQRNPMYPYPTTYESPDGSLRSFTYLDGMEDRILLFHCMDDDKTPICIKFVPHYCEAGHKFLAAKGFAPKLRAVNRLRGGMYMVVMDDVSAEYVSLFDMIQERPDLLLEDHLGTRDSFSEKVGQCLQEFHQAAYVHGDVRNTNIMVKRDGSSFDDGSFLLVDYDFAGKIPEARYPLDLNTIEVKRPEGAIGGAVIQAQHDIAMLEFIWNRPLDVVTL